MQEEEKKKNKKDKQKEIEELNLKIKSLEEEVLRSKADLINYRKRKDFAMLCQRVHSGRRRRMARNVAACDDGGKRGAGAPPCVLQKPKICSASSFSHPPSSFCLLKC